MKMHQEMVRKEFENPSAEYRIKPFWFWNGDMSKTEIRNQIKEMADKGLGGMFICARQGLTVPYLSEEWFERVAYACDVAKEYGLEAWLYDEYPYPSGMSGGEVLLEHPEAVHTYLVHKTYQVEGGEEFTADLGWNRVLYAKAFRRTEGTGESIDLKAAIGNLQTEKIYQKSSLTRYSNKRFFTYGPSKILRTTLPEGSWQIEVYLEATIKDFKYYGNYLDPCNPDAVRSFLETTHEKYRHFLGDRLGCGVPGMFADEVGFLGGIPWSRLLPARFRERNGYDLLAVLPAIHDRSIPGAVKIRYDLYNTMHEMFRENYHRRVAEWCEENNLLYATEVPSMRLTTQKYSHVVGGDTGHDKLGKPLQVIYDSSMRNYRSNAKAISSLARQLGRKYAMVESFHSVGWSMTLQDAKWMIDRLGSCGINFYNFHAFYYTIQDITKHDAPPSQFLQNPYWKHYRKLADYVGRMGSLITNTEADISIAVLDPAAALWTRLGNPFHGYHYQGESEEEAVECTQIRDKWLHICKTLLYAQMDYDHLDAESLAEAQVRDGKIRIGSVEYSVVILPPCPCMESAAREKLQEFTNQGGCLIGMEMIPYEAIEENDEAQELWKQLFQSENVHFLEQMDDDRLLELCREYSLDSLRCEVTEGDTKSVVSSVRRDIEGNYYLFMANQGKEPVTFSARMLSEDGDSASAEEWVLENGQTRQVAMGAEGLCVSLGAFESKWFRICKKAYEPTQDKELPIVKIPFAGKKKISIEGKNICRFESAWMSLDENTWKRVDAEPFIEQCRNSGLAGGDMLKYTREFGTPERIGLGYPFDCWYRVEFDVEYLAENIALLMDREALAGEYSVQINDTLLPSDRWESVFVNDHNNQAADIRDMVKMGRNTIVFHVTIHKDEEGLRDPFYLWGSFGVKPSDTCPVLTGIPHTADMSGHWMEGYPYYSGTICLEDTVELQADAEKFALELAFPHAIYDCVEVILNGHSLGVQAYTPYRWECCREWVSDGDNSLTVKITNTLANMLDGTYFDYDEHRVVKIS